MEKTVRVLVASSPRLLREMVLSALSEQLGIQVVGEADDQRQLPEIVGRAARFSCDRDGEESPSENMRHVP